MNCSSVTSLLQLVLTSQAREGRPDPDTECSAVLVALTLDPCEPCPDRSVIQSIWASGIFLM